MCLIPLVDKREWQINLCDPSLTPAIRERFRDEQLTIKRCTNKADLYLFFASSKNLRRISEEIRTVELAM